MRPLIVGFLVIVTVMPIVPSISSPIKPTMIPPTASPTIKDHFIIQSITCIKFCFPTGKLVV